MVSLPVINSCTLYKQKLRIMCKPTPKGFDCTDSGNKKVSAIKNCTLTQVSNIAVSKNLPKFRTKLFKPIF